jgi:hypothetical protein
MAGTPFFAHEQDKFHLIQDLGLEQATLQLDAELEAASHA